MPPSTDSSNLVTLLDPSTDSKSLSFAEIISLPHPNYQEPQDFLFLSRTSTAPATILQVQSLRKPFGSFFIGSRILSNGALHVATRVDPMYFVLAHLATDDHSTPKWQPLDQLLENISEYVQQSVSSEHQYRHLCSTNDQFGSIILYKFQEQRALAWLERKYKVALQVLEGQLVAEKQRIKQHSDGGGAFTNTFNFISDNDETVTDSEDTTCSTLERTTLQHEACHVVCDYLTMEWSAKFVQHLKLPPTTINICSETSTATTKRKWEGVAGSSTHDDLVELTLGTNLVTVEQSKHNEIMKKKLKAQSSGLKQLAKVKTKGMKSMSAFFGVKKK